MSGWRAALVAGAVGGVILLAGWIASSGGGDTPASTTVGDAPIEGAALACPEALETACRDLAADLGVPFLGFEGEEPGAGTVVLAPAADLPATLEAGPVVGRSPIAIVVWRERANLLAAACGSVDLACLETAYGRDWADLGGDPAWGAFKVGLAEPTTAAGLAAWSLVATDGVPPGLADSLRLRAADDGSLMLEIAQFGDSRADAAVTTEAAIASQLENVQGRAGRFEVFYPDPTPWVEYVAAASSGTGRRLAERLLDPEAQATLASRGVRPVAGEAAGLPAGLGQPGSPAAAPDEPAVAALLAAWDDLP
jgi:hypothetical protein